MKKMGLQAFNGHHWKFDAKFWNKNSTVSSGACETIQSPSSWTWQGPFLNLMVLVFYGLLKNIFCIVLVFQNGFDLFMGFLWFFLIDGFSIIKFAIDNDRLFFRWEPSKSMLRIKPDIINQWKLCFFLFIKDLLKFNSKKGYWSKDFWHEKKAWFFTIGWKRDHFAKQYAESLQNLMRMPLKRVARFI